MGEHATVEHAEDTTTPNAHAGSPHVDSAGLGELRAMLASGRPSPQQVAEIVKRYPHEQGAMFAMLHGMLGNAFVHQVLEATTETADVTAIANGQVTATPAPTAPPKTTDPAVESLLTNPPSGTRGPGGCAAWLLRAAGLGFLTTGQAGPQLESFRDERPAVHTRDEHRGKQVDDADRAKHPGWYDNVDLNPSGGYDVRLDQSSILPALVTIVTKGIERWKIAGGARPKILQLGDYVRADFGFKFESKHRGGHAIDLFIDKPSTNDAVDLLRDLPPGDLQVFIDNPNALHLDKRGTGYGLGIPVGHGYVPSEIAMGGKPNYRSGQQDRLEREANAKNDHTSTLHTTCVRTEDGAFFRSEATWDGTKWDWKKWEPTAGNAEALITSDPLKQAIADYRARSRAAKRAP